MPPSTKFLSHPLVYAIHFSSGRSQGHLPARLWSSQVWPELNSNLFIGKYLLYLLWFVTQWLILSVCITFYLFLFVSHCVYYYLCVYLFLYSSFSLPLNLCLYIKSYNFPSFCLSDSLISPTVSVCFFSFFLSVSLFFLQSVS